MAPLCIVCNKSAPFLCLSCASATYCSAKCLNDDKKLHSKICKALTGAHTNEHPADIYTSIYVSCIHLGTKSRVPQLVRIKCDKVTKEGICTQVPHLEDIVGLVANQVKIRSEFEEKYDGNGHAVQIWFLEKDGGKAGTKGRALNKCLLSMTNTNHYGDVVIMNLHREVVDVYRQPPGLVGGRELVSKETTSYDNVTARDCRVALKYFAENGTDETDIPRRAIARIQKGVRISCLGEQKFAKQPMYKSMAVGKNHQICFMGTNSQIGRQMGLPLRVLKIRSNGIPDVPQLWGGMDPWENCVPYYLLLGASSKEHDDPNKDMWGRSDLKKWDIGPVGAALVIRTDGKDLAPRQLEALYHYFREVCHDKMMELQSPCDYFSEEEAEDWDEEAQRKKVHSNIHVQGEIRGVLGELQEGKGGGRRSFVGRGTITIR